MCRIPNGLNFHPLIGEFTTQICVGQFDIQINFNVAKLRITSPIKLTKDESIIGSWDEGLWPSQEFYHIMNNKIISCRIVAEEAIEIEFENKIIMSIIFNKEYESVLIDFKGDPLTWVI